MMSDKKNGNYYEIDLKELILKDGSQTDRALTLTFDLHDDLFRIIDIVLEKNLFEDKGESMQFVLGLKLLSEIILKNKTHPLFDELKPAIVQFMKKLKSNN